jgi:hypothetical protein
VARIQKINDMSTAEEEELEAREVRGRQGDDDSAVPETNAGLGNTTEPQDGNRLPRTLEDIGRTSTDDLMKFAVGFVERMKEQSVDWLRTNLFTTYGDCPNDPTVFPWWFANILPIGDAEKYRLLSTTSIRERLKICCGWIIEWEQNTW